MLVAVSCLAVYPAVAEVAFERMELSFDHAIAGWLHGDIDRDGDSDLLVLRTRSGNGSPMHTATFIRQQPTGRYDFPRRQVFDLRDSTGVYELADVAEGELLELIQVNRDGVRYFPFLGAQFDTVPKQLIRPEHPPDLPPVSEPSAWDCGWALLTDSKECIAVPYVNRLEIWTGGPSGGYSLAHTVSCATIGDLGPGKTATTFTYGLPRVLNDVSPTTLELYIQSGRLWHGLRRSALSQVDFEPYLSFECETAATVPLLSLGPLFSTGRTMIDINGDGSLDVISWRNIGSTNRTSCQVDAYFGPIIGSLPITPHAQVSVEGVVGYPEFGDLNGDGRLDMVVCTAEAGPMASAKVFVMKRLKFHLLAFRQRPDNSFSVVPDARLKFDYRLDFDRSRPFEGPLIRFLGDMDGNGTEDLVVQTGGDRLEVYRGDTDDLLDDSPQRLECSDANAMESLDLDGDGRSDMFLCHRPVNSPHRITALLTR
jgi:hypothetical protein